MVIKGVESKFLEVESYYKKKKKRRKKSNTINFYFFFRKNITFAYEGSTQIYTIGHSTKENVYFPLI